MKVFKFGGASVKDADGVKNVLKVLREVGDTDLVVVVSAMGKTTNALEKIVKRYLDDDPELLSLLRNLEDDHYEILKGLFYDQTLPVFDRIKELMLDLKTTIKRNKSAQYDYVYVQIVCFGELISTTIVSAYLLHEGYSAFQFILRT